MVVAHNLSAMNTQRQFGAITGALSKSMEKLSSGYKVNRSADDAAGLAISEKMRAQIKGLNKGGDNIQNGISLIGVADGALEEVQGILQRMNELSVQAANDTNTFSDRKALQNEVSELAKEISRIGKDTTFNTMHILDDAFSTNTTSITQLVTCAAADDGYLTEAIQANNGNWYSSATLDFSNIDATNIAKLHNKGFSFNCSQNCSEVFEFKFVTDGTASSASNLQGKVHHMYTIDISACQSGSDIIDTIFSFVRKNPPIGNGAGGSTVFNGAIGVSHSNEMIRSGNTLTIYENWRGYSTEETAKKVYANGNNGAGSGAIDCTSLTKKLDDDAVNEFKIQCSSNNNDYQSIKTHKINAGLLDVDTLTLTSHYAASSSIKKVADALEKVSSYRSELGAYNNRLEYSYNNAKNSEENIQRAESAIRDTDMAEEMADYMKNNILSQVSNGILAQANLNNQSVLKLLQ